MNLQPPCIPSHPAAPQSRVEVWAGDNCHAVPIFLWLIANRVCRSGTELQQLGAATIQTNSQHIYSRSLKKARMMPTTTIANRIQLALNHLYSAWRKTLNFVSTWVNYRFRYHSMKVCVAASNGTTFWIQIKFKVFCHNLMVTYQDRANKATLWMAITTTMYCTNFILCSNMAKVDVITSTLLTAVLQDSLLSQSTYMCIN